MPCKKLAAIFCDNYFERKKIKLFKNLKKEKDKNNKVDFSMGVFFGIGVVGALSYYMGKKYN
jgi:hypothetical protein